MASHACRTHDGQQESIVQMRKSYTREYKLTLLPSDYKFISEKDGVFGFHVNTYHLEPLVAAAEDILAFHSTDRSIAVHVHVAYVLHAIHVGRGFIIASLLGAYPLLGACMLTTYAHKRIRLLTRVYGTSSNIAVHVILH